MIVFKTMVSRWINRLPYLAGSRVGFREVRRGACWDRTQGESDDGLAREERQATGAQNMGGGKGAGLRLRREFGWAPAHKSHEGPALQG